MGDHKPVLLKFKLPVQRPSSSGGEEATVKCESSAEPADDPGKAPATVKDEKSALGNHNFNESNRFQNNLDMKPNNNSRRSKKRNKRKNSQRKLENQRAQLNSVSGGTSESRANDVQTSNKLNDISNSMNSKTSNQTNDKLNDKMSNNLINPNAPKLINANEKNGLNDGQFDLKDKEKRLPPLPLRTMSLAELSNETIKTKRLLLTDKKNHSTSFDQEKIRRTTIHNEEWYQKTQKLFDYSKYLAQGDLKNLTETNDLVALRKGSLNENYCSSRLTSHHSSSSEEWYKEIHEKMRKVENERLPKSFEDLNSESIAINSIESNIVNKILSLQDEKSALNEAKSEAKNETKNDTDISLACDKAANEVEETAGQAVTDRESEKLAESGEMNGKVKEDQQTVVDEATAKPNEKPETEPVELTQTEKSSLDKSEPLTAAEPKTNHTNHANHTNSVSPPTAKEQMKKKKSRRLSRIGKKCVLMYISPSLSCLMLITTNILLMLFD